MLHPNKIEKDILTLTDIALMREIRDYTSALQQFQKCMKLLNDEANRRVDNHINIEGGPSPANNSEGAMPPKSRSTFSPKQNKNGKGNSGKKSGAKTR